MMSCKLNQSLSFVSEPSDNANVSCVVYKGDYYVTGENNCMYKVDPETLEMKEKVWAGGARGLTCGTRWSLFFAPRGPQ